jgi:alpha-tubulin suppressor-like RCC1 family protein
MHGIQGSRMSLPLYVGGLLFLVFLALPAQANMETWNTLLGGSGGDSSAHKPEPVVTFKSTDDLSAELPPPQRQQIQAQIQAHQHQIVMQEGKYWRAKNNRQQWLTDFTPEGFVVTPKDKDWRWGLALDAYGVAGSEQAVERPVKIRAEGMRIEYTWDDTLSEWMINDPRHGLEHGFTLTKRPIGEGNELRFALRVLGGLQATTVDEGLGIDFVAADGTTELHYSGLKVFDATGKTLPARMAAVDDQVQVRIDDYGAVYPVTIDPIAQQAYVKASNTEADDWFSLSVAIDGDTVVVGVPGEDSATTGINGNQADNSANSAGAAYVFVRSGTTWIQQAYLKASNTEAGDNFGVSVAISGDTVVVGAYTEDSAATGINGNQADNSTAFAGAVYVFLRSGTTWTQQAYLKASNTGVDDLFGWSVAVSGDTVVVGAISEDSAATGINGNQADNTALTAGAAYVFLRSGTTWTQQAYLKASNTETVDRFGYSVSISGDTVVVGASQEDSAATGVNGNQADNTAADSGAAYVFVRSGTVWIQQAYLKASNTGTAAWFGSSVAIDGDTVVVGAREEDNTAIDSGAAYVFVRSGTTWTQQAYLKASNTEASDFFGSSVAISGDTVVVGASQEDSAATGVNGNQADNTATDAGAAYVFVRSGSTWTQQAYLKASNTEASDRFGLVAISGDTVVVGAHYEDSAATGINGNQADNAASSAGAAYVFTPGINTAPSLDNSGTPALTAVAANDSNPPGDLVSDLIAALGGTGITDLDIGAVQGIAVTAVDNTNGTWEFSTNGGGAWTAFGTPADNAAVVLTDTANDKIRFVPNASYSGTVDPGITFRAWDTTDSNASGTTAVDTSLNGGSTAYSTAVETASITVNPQNALVLDGVNDFVSISPGFNIANQSFAIEFWAKRATTGNDDMLISQGTTAPNAGLHIGFRPSDVFTCAFFSNDLDTVSTYTDSNWHHWACVYDATTNERWIYQDGNLVANDVAAADYQGSGDVRLGKTSLIDSEFGGKIDEVRIWNTTRSQAQIQANMSCDIAPQAGLLAYYRLNQGIADGNNSSETSADDNSGNGYAGTLSGFALTGTTSNWTTGVLSSCVDFALLSHTPTANAPNIATTSTIQGVFNNSLDTATLDNTTVKVHGSQSGLHTATAPFPVTTTNTTNDTFTFTPTTPFLPGETVTVTITAAFDPSMAKPYSWQFTVQAGVGPATFYNSGQALGGNKKDLLSYGDLDGDGDVDFIQALGIGGANLEPNRVWFNDGTGVFTDSGQLLGGNDWSMEIALGDIDGDGDLDAFEPIWGNSINRIWLNNGSGSFSQGGTAPTGSVSGAVLVDVDGDGDLDLYLTIDSVPNQIWFNDGNANFSNSGQSLTSNAGRWDFGDVDNDGDLDLVVAVPGGNNVLWLNDGNGFFTVSSSPVGSSSADNNNRVQLLDIDHDGVLELLLPNDIWENDGSGIFSATGTISATVSNGNTLQRDVGDVNGDGWLDYRGADSDIWLNNGAGVFVATGQTLDPMMLVDVDGDGDLDGVSNKWAAPAVTVWYNATLEVTTTADDGPGSLRRAIEMANATPNAASTEADLISFNIPATGPHVISPLSPLPVITEAVVINATTQPGTLLDTSGSTNHTLMVQIDGSSPGLTANGLQFDVGGNTVSGLMITNFSGDGLQFNSTGTNTVSANFIGSDGTTALGNGGDGIAIAASSLNNIIQSNVISANGTNGVTLLSAGNLIDGNSIGTNAAGTAVLGNGDNGIALTDAPNNLIQNNVLSGNLGSGLTISGTASAGTQILNNFIGTDRSATLPLGNQSEGVLLSNGIANLTITGNTIAYNTQAGVFMDTAGEGNALDNNIYFLNGGLDIDLGTLGTTANDAGDADSGPNALQNYPELTGAYANTTLLQIVGTLNSTPSSNFTLSFYGSFGTSPPTLLGTLNVSTDGVGNMPIRYELPPGAVTPGYEIRALATSATGNTSEFSAPVVVENLVTATLAISGSPSETGPTPGDFIINLDNPAPTSGLNVNISVAGSATANTDYNALGTVYTLAAGQSTLNIPLSVIDDTLLELNESVTVTLVAGDGYLTAAPASATLSILDNDTASVNLSLSATSATEADIIDVIVSSTVSMVSNESVTIAVTSGTADADDYTLITTALALPAGSSSASTSLTLTNDTLIEGTESLTLSIVSVSGKLTAAPASATLSILDNDTASVNLSLSATSVAEANTLEVIVSSSVAMITAESVTIAVSGGTADSADYSLSTTSLALPVGSSSASASLTLIDDTLIENTETLELSIVSVSGKLTLGSPVSATLEILDNNLPSVDLSLSATTGNESLQQTIELTVTSSDPVPTAQTVSFVIGGTATADADYQLAATSVTIPAGDSSAVTTLNILDDAALEGQENVTISLDTTGSALVPGVNSSQTLLIEDDERAQIILSQTDNSTAVGEGGAHDVYTVELASSPTADVTISIKPDPQLLVGSSTQAYVDNSGSLALLFSPNTWNVAQSVTVLAFDDNIAEGAHQGIITHRASSADPLFNAVPLPSLTVAVTDNETPGLHIQPSGNSNAVTEGGSGDTYLLSLSSEPTADVRVSLTPDAQLNLGGGAGTTVSRNFSPHAWHQAQSIGIQALDDYLAEGVHLGHVNHAVSSSDPAYHGINAATLQVTINDNDVPGILLVETEGATDTREDGAQDTYSIALATQPRDVVTVTLSVDAQLRAAPLTLSFDATNWRTAQTVAVSAVDDNAVEGLHHAAIEHQVTSTDSDYHQFAAAQVVVGIEDNDIPGLLLQVNDAQLSEDGETGSLSVRLNSQPAAEVQVSIPATAQLTANPDSLNFSAANWNTAQNVVVSAVNDAVVEGSHAALLTLVSSSHDDAYQQLSHEANFSLSDNDSATLNIEIPPGGIQLHSGSELALPVTLNSQPSATVAISLTPEAPLDLGAGPGEPITLSFTPDTWQTPQFITVQTRSGGAGGSFFITLNINSIDPAYQTLTQPPLGVTVIGAVVDTPPIPDAPFTPNVVMRYDDEEATELTIDFGVTRTGYNIYEEIIIFNRGEQTIKLSNFELSPDYRLETEIPDSLSPGVSAVLGIRMVANVPGEYEGRLSFVVTGDSGDSQQVEEFFAMLHTIVERPEPTIEPALPPPSDLQLSSNSVQENLPAGTSVGTLSLAENALPVGFNLSSDNPDNFYFQIAGNEVLSNTVFDHEVRKLYRISVIVTNEQGDSESYDLVINIAPQTVQALELALGWRHGCARQKDNNLACWGWNNFAQITVPEETRFTHISLGDNHSCGIRADNHHIICWGSNDTGQIDAPDGEFKTVSAGGSHTCAIDMQGKARCWGYNYNGQSQAPSDSFKQLSAGGFHSCGIKADDTLVCWGWNNFAQSNPPQGRFQALDSGEYHNCAIDENGVVQCWGKNIRKQSTVPDNMQAISISAGAEHSCALTRDKRIVCWGKDNNGQSSPPGGNTFLAVHANADNACALRQDGSILCWGRDDFGQATPPTAPTNRRPLALSFEQQRDDGIEANTVIGEFSTYDLDETDTHSYTLIEGEGDNLLFYIEDNKLLALEALQSNRYEIHVRTDDGFYGVLDQTFVLELR